MDWSVKFINIPGPFTNTFKYIRWNLIKAKLVVKAVENILCKCGEDKISLLLCTKFSTWRNMSIFRSSIRYICDSVCTNWAWSSIRYISRLQVQLNSLTSQLKGINSDFTCYSTFRNSYQHMKVFTIRKQSAPNFSTRSKTPISPSHN